MPSASTPITIIIRTHCRRHLSRASKHRSVFFSLFLNQHRTPLACYSSSSVIYLWVLPCPLIQFVSSSKSKALIIGGFCSPSAFLYILISLLSFYCLISLSTTHTLFLSLSINLHALHRYCLPLSPLLLSIGPPWPVTHLSLSFPSFQGFPRVDSPKFIAISCARLLASFPFWFLSTWTLSIFTLLARLLFPPNHLPSHSLYVLPPRLSNRTRPLLFVLAFASNVRLVNRGIVILQWNEIVAVPKGWKLAGRRLDENEPSFQNIAFCCACGQLGLDPLQLHGMTRTFGLHAADSW